MPTINVAVFKEMRPAVLVVSHERSGSHFLMNALAGCYGYQSAPWIDLDWHCFNINYYCPAELRDLLLTLAGPPLANVVKSHHQADFYAGDLARLTERYVIFCIHRDPVGVMLSVWRFLHTLTWVEGPKAPDPLALARAEPCGQMMRYQVRQHPTLLHRWAAHVDGWRAAAAAVPGIVIVRYEDLDARFEETVRGFAPALGRPPNVIERPSRDVNVIPGGPADPTGLGIVPDKEALRALCRELVGETMARAGY
jgi:hypothetical protein